MPDSAWAQLVTKVFDWFKSAAHAMTVVAILTGLILFLPATWLRVIGLTSATIRYALPIRLAFGFSLVFLLTQPFFGQNAIFRRYVSKRKIKQRLACLTKTEKPFLKRFVTEDRSTIPCIGDLVEIASLVGDGILVKSVPQPEVGIVSGQVWYTMPIWILEHLRSNPRLLG